MKYFKDKQLLINIALDRNKIKSRDTKRYFKKKKRYSDAGN